MLCALNELLAEAIPNANGHPSAQMVALSELTYSNDKHLLEFMIPAPAHSVPSTCHSFCKACTSSKINCIALRLLDSESSNGTSQGGDERE